jgi:hypothetical protein
VLELLALRIAHDRSRFAIGLDREALLIPGDRLGLFGERSAEPCECPRLLRQFVLGVVVLVESRRRRRGAQTSAGSRDAS